MTDAIDIELLTHQVTQLPPLPQAVLEVMRASRRPDLSARRSIELIECDPALAARTLRLANSAFYGVPGRVGSIGDAVRMLGLRTVSAVLASAALHNALRVDACPGFDFQVHWRHAIGAALAARALSSHAGLDADEAFLAGLMHDIGQLVLAAFLPKEAGLAIALARESDAPAETAELALLGIAHPHIGALVADHWHFPASITLAIERHHAPEPAAPGQRISMSGLVQVADAIAHSLDLNADPDEAVPPVAADVWQGLALGEADALRIFAATERGVREMSDALNAG
jgi:HD-like signal output (HDOD) protein